MSKIQISRDEGRNLKIHKEGNFIGCLSSECYPNLNEPLEIETFEFEGSEYFIIDSREGMNSSNHCEFCELLEVCETRVGVDLDYIFCGCEFQAGPYYIKKV